MSIWCKPHLRPGAVSAPTLNLKRSIMHKFSLFPFRRFSWISSATFFVAIVGCSDQSPTEPGLVRAPSVHVLQSLVADAAVPQPVTITITVHHDFEAGTIEGTWEAAGAFTDQGTVEWTGFAVRGGPPLFSAGHVFAKAILSSARGSFEMHSREHWTSAPDPQNTWVAGHGVGFYEGLQGQGTMTVTIGTETAPGLVVSTGYVTF